MKLVSLSKLLLIFTTLIFLSHSAQSASSIVEDSEWNQLIPAHKAMTVLSALKSRSQNCGREAFAQKLSDRFLITFTEEHQPCRIHDLAYPSFWKEQKSLPILEVQSPPSIKKISDEFSRGQHIVEIEKQNPQLTLNIQDSKVLKEALTKINPLLTKTQLSSGIRIKQVTQINPNLFKKVDLDFKMALAQISSIKKLSQDQGTLRFQSQAPSKDLEFVEDPNVLLNQIIIKENSSGHIQVQMSPQLTHFGATALLDFNQPQKILIEILIQQVTSFAATRIVQLVPHPLIANIISTALNDLFQLIQLNHFEQLYHLEAVLRQNVGGMRANAIDKQALEASLDLLYAHHSKSILESALAGFKNGFSNDNWFRAAHSARVESENAMASNRNHFLSQLKSQPRCTFRQINDLFGVCEQKGKPHSLYSLTSKETFSYISFGPKILYSYARPWQVTSLKGFAWAVSSSVRVLNPFEKINLFGLFRLSGFIAQLFSNYAQEGLREQAFWWQHMNWAKENQMIDPAYSDIQEPWLKTQSLNPVNLFRSHY